MFSLPITLNSNTSNTESSGKKSEHIHTLLITLKWTIKHFIYVDLRLKSKPKCMPMICAEHNRWQTEVQLNKCLFTK